MDGGRGALESQPASLPACPPAGCSLQMLLAGLDGWRTLAGFGGGSGKEGQAAGTPPPRGSGWLGEGFSQQKQLSQGLLRAKSPWHLLKRLDRIKSASFVVIP